MTSFLPRRRTAVGLLAAYVVLLAVVLLQPVPTIATGVVGGLDQALVNLGLPAALTEPGRVELVVNAAMFAPVSLLATLVWPRHPWANWVVYGFLGSAGVEVVQALLLSARSAQHVDVVANTLGALTGALLGLLLTRREATTEIV